MTRPNAPCCPCGGPGRALTLAGGYAYVSRPQAAPGACTGGNGWRL